MPEAPEGAKRYRHKPTIIHAVQLTRPSTVLTPHGPIDGEIGDWHCFGPEGEEWFNKEAMFLDRYEPIDADPSEDP